MVAGVAPLVSCGIVVGGARGGERTASLAQIRAARSSGSMAFGGVRGGVLERVRLRRLRLRTEEARDVREGAVLCGDVHVRLLGERCERWYSVCSGTSGTNGGRG